MGCLFGISFYVIAQLSPPPTPRKVQLRKKRTRENKTLKSEIISIHIASILVDHCT